MSADATARPPVRPPDLKHLAIIMDGNGRWANARGLARSRGHKEGVKSVRRTTTTCAALGFEQLTLYALSVENFRKRPPAEVEFLLHLLRRFVIQERRTIMENDIRFRTIGRTHEFPRRVRNELEKLTEVSAANQGMVLCLALNYGGRAEIADAVKAIVADRDLDPEDVDEDFVRRHLYDSEMSDPDLLVRTAGELRISNFLLWQVSYSEIYVTDNFWPEFDEPELGRAMAAYTERRRKFGGLLKEADA